MKKLILEPYCDKCPFFEAEPVEIYYQCYSVISDHQVTCRYKHQCAFAVERYEALRKENKYHNPFGNPIYVYMRVGDKTVTIKADDLQKALDYVTEHGEEVTIEGRSDNNDLKHAPTIEPERKKGKWTGENACEFCGFQPWYERDIHTLSYCPNCGADMRK